MIETHLEENIIKYFMRNNKRNYRKHPLQAAGFKYRFGQYLTKRNKTGFPHD